MIPTWLFGIIQRTPNTLKKKSHIDLKKSVEKEVIDRLCITNKRLLTFTKKWCLHLWFQKKLKSRSLVLQPYVAPGSDLALKSSQHPFPSFWGAGLWLQCRTPWGLSSSCCSPSHPSLANLPATSPVRPRPGPGFKTLMVMSLSGRSLHRA